MSKTKLAFIGGTGVYHPGILTNLHEEIIHTPYGDAKYESGNYGDKEIIFLARHGVHHTIPPHKINYRANIYALKMLGVNSVVATAAVGTINPNYKPGELVLIDQFIDMTKNRECTFYDGVHRGVAHIDMTHPYCGTLRSAIIKIAKEKNIVLHPQGTYITTDGPRFETAAEIKAYRMWGADVVGMTNVPECPLAREAGICYSAIAMVTNYAAGMTENPLTHKEVVDFMSHNVSGFRTIITELAKHYDPDVDCFCHHASDDFGGFKV